MVLGCEGHGQEVVLVAIAAEVLKVGYGLVLEQTGVAVLIGRGPMLIGPWIVLDSLEPEVLALKHESRILGQWSNPVCGLRNTKPVLHGPNSTDSNLFYHGETTCRVG